MIGQRVLYAANHLGVSPPIVLAKSRKNRVNGYCSLKQLIFSAITRPLDGDIGQGPSHRKQGGEQKSRGKPNLSWC